MPKKLRKQREIRALYQKAEGLRRRLNASEWKTYAGLIQESNILSQSPEEQERFNQEHYAYILCDRPAICTWHLMLTLQEIGTKYEAYFGDVEAKRGLLQEIFRMAEASRKVFKNDPFLSEILYAQLYALRDLQNYRKLKVYAEEFLLEYPDYRLIEAAEDLYEEALDHLAGQE